jgi:hypothetical protein
MACDSHPAVDTKFPGAATIGNYAGFIRVRRRELKGGHPDLRLYRARVGDERATTSMSFDLVRAVRVNGKPRHQFLLGLGSQKNDRRAVDRYFTFWLFAISRMAKHGLSELQRRRLMNEMVRKGAQLPSPGACELQAPAWRKHRPSECDELVRFMRDRQQGAEPLSASGELSSPCSSYRGRGAREISTNRAELLRWLSFG